MPELPDLEVYFQGIEDQALCGWLGQALGRRLVPEPRSAGWSAQHGNLSLRTTTRALATALACPWARALVATPWGTDQAPRGGLATAFLLGEAPLCRRTLGRRGGPRNRSLFRMARAGLARNPMEGVRPWLRGAPWVLGAFLLSLIPRAPPRGCPFRAKAL